MYFPVLAVLESGLSNSRDRLMDTVKRMEMRMTKQTDGIESDDRKRGRKEQCSDKKDEERRLRGGRVITRKTNGKK